MSHFLNYDDDDEIVDVDTYVDNLMRTICPFEIVDERDEMTRHALICVNDQFASNDIDDTNDIDTCVASFVNGYIVARMQHVNDDASLRMRRRYGNDKIV